MPPIPCAHCGVNFMRVNLDPEAPRLCNNCLLREEKRVNQKKKDNMSTIDIVITCPREEQIKIEEYCINHGMDFTRYFLELHYASQHAIELMKNPEKLKEEESTEYDTMEARSKVSSNKVEKMVIQKGKVKK